MNLESVVKLPMVEVDATCKIHGDYTATVLVRDGQPRPAECAICQMALIRAERDEDAKQQLQATRKHRQESLIKSIELPERMESTKWADYQPPTDNAAKILRTCRTFADQWQVHGGHHGNLIMLGTTGTGKTHLASMICKQVAVQNNAQVLYTTSARMGRYIRASYSKKCEYTEAEAFERYVRLDLLVIDEVGRKLQSEFESTTLDELIDERSMRRAPTIVISNLNISEIKEMTGARLVSRLSENGTLMVFDWADSRGKS